MSRDERREAARDVFSLAVAFGAFVGAVAVLTVGMSW